jgi:DHA1 family tetracycline resistance protein-like MFS transporter
MYRSLWRSKAQPGAWHAFVVILPETLMLGMLMPMLPDILRSYSNSPQEIGTHVGYFLGIYSFIQVMVAPMLGVLSDRYGRRPVLLFSFFFSSITYLFMAMASSFWMLFLGRIISGATNAIIPLASSYIADVSNDDNRAANFGWLGSAAAIGFSAGPLLGSWLGQWDVMAPFWAAALFSVLAFGFVLLVMPESMTCRKPVRISWAKLYPFASLVKFLKPSALSGLIWVYALVFLAFQVIPANWTLYTQAKIGWSTQDVGRSLTVLGIMFALGQGILPKFIIVRVGEMRALLQGIFVLGLSLVFFSLADKTWMIYSSLVLFTCSAHLMPTLQSLLVQHVTAEEQGELQGSLIAVRGCLSAIAPVLYNKLFNWLTYGSTEFQYPGIAFVAAAFLLLLTFPLLQFSVRYRQKAAFCR